MIEFLQGLLAGFVGGVVLVDAWWWHDLDALVRRLSSERSEQEEAGDE